MRAMHRSKNRSVKNDFVLIRALLRGIQSIAPVDLVGVNLSGEDYVAIFISRSHYCLSVILGVHLTQRP